MLRSGQPWLSPLARSSAHRTCPEEMIAKEIIKLAQTGIKDPAQISALAIKELEIR